MGTIEGGKRAKATIYKVYGHNYFRVIGSKGGSSKKRKGSGFASEKVGADGLTGKERAVIAGRKGGTKSRRNGICNGQGKVHQERKYVWEMLNYEHQNN